MLFKALKSVLYTTSGLLLTGILLEIFIRIFIPQAITPSGGANSFIEVPFNGYPNSLAIKSAHTKNFPYYVKTDDDGLRNFRNYTYQKPDNTFRILTLGDSVFFGANVNVFESFSYYLERVLNQKTPSTKFQVISGAGVGGDILTFYRLLKNKYYKYSPDLVVFSFNLNDLNLLNEIEFDSANTEKESDNKIKIILKGMRIKPHTQVPTNKIADRIMATSLYRDLSQVSMLLNLIRYRLSAMKQQHQITDDRYNLSKYMRSLNWHGNEEITWIIDGHEYVVFRGKANPVLYLNEFSGDRAKNKPYLVLYFWMIDQIVELSNSLNIKILGVELPRFLSSMGMSGLKYSYPNMFRDFIPNKEFSWLNLHESFFLFQFYHPMPLWLIHDNHWAPAGHYLAALLTFNHLLENHLIPIDDKNSHPIDINDPKIVDAVQKANSRLEQLFAEQDYPSLIQAMNKKNHLQFTEAIPLLTSYVEKHPDDAEANFQLGVTYLVSGDCNSALNYFKKATTGATAERDASFYMQTSLRQNYLCAKGKP